MDSSILLVMALAIMSHTAIGRSWHGFSHGFDERFGHGFGHDIPDQRFFKHQGVENHKPWLGGPPDWEFPGHGHYPWKNSNDADDKYDDYSNWRDEYPEQASRNWNEVPWVNPDASNIDIAYTTTPRDLIQTTPRTTSTTSPVLTTLLCIRSCPTTSEYNPVCGSNNITYNNPGRLECAKYCGVDVVLQRRSPCRLPTTTTNPPTENVTTTSDNPSTNTGNNDTNSNANSTISPISNDMKPTRYTTIDFKPTNTFGDSNQGNSQTSEQPNSNNGLGFTIPIDVLGSIFTNPSPSVSITDLDLRIKDKDERIIFSS